jgi:hypothetical protein
MVRIDPIIGGLALVAGALAAFFILSPKQDMSAALDRSKPLEGPKDERGKRSSSRRRSATSRSNYNKYMKDYMRKRRAAAKSLPSGSDPRAAGSS